MTSSALIMMVIAWTVILFFAIRFLIKVIRTPQEKKNEPEYDAEKTQASEEK